MAIEAAGVPTVSVHAPAFAGVVRSVTRANGLPTIRQAYVPRTIMGRTPAELRAFLDQNDPVNQRPLMPEIIGGLTDPLTDEDLEGISFERTTPRLVEPDTEDALQALFIRNGWTDFLPIVLPTEERVARMLTGTSHRPDEVVGQLRPTSGRESWEFTVEKVAVNAVMAGARPEHLPVILALAASGMSARSSSTTSFATLSVVNGPIRQELGMNAGIGAMGPYNHANAAIGRAFGLLSQNLQGGSVPNDTYMGSLGNWYAYTATFPENEERSPWEPFHVQHGFKPTDSTISTFLGGWYTQAGYGTRDTWEQKFKHCLSACEPYLAPMLVLDPLAARGLVERGFDTKQKLIDWCWENARITAREYWDNPWTHTLIRPLALNGVEPYASHLAADPDQLVRMFRQQDINVVVVGGETTSSWKMIGASYRGNTVPVDAWR
jgi:hypothetical protein